MCFSAFITLSRRFKTFATFRLQNHDLPLWLGLPWRRLKLFEFIANLLKSSKSPFCFCWRLVPAMLDV